MKTLGIITYDTNHLKTEQILLQLIGKYNMKVYALPYIQRPARKVLFQHRPNQFVAAHPWDICKRYGLPYISVVSDIQIDNHCDLYLITGAGILSAECVQGKRILNSYPGVIPAVRGLDAFKWSIFEQIPLGVTLRYIDEEVDAGEVVSIVPTPVFSSDTLETLARRHYENEIQMLSNFGEYLEHSGNPFAGLAKGDSRRRMKAEQEAELQDRFEQYKRQMMSLSKSTPGGQMSLRRGCPEKLLSWDSARHDLQEGAA